MGKLMRVARGEAFIVAVDIRPGSPTLGRYESIVASDENHLQLWAPASFARGFCALSEIVDIEYFTTGTYGPHAESGIAWNDPDIGIDVAHQGTDPVRQGCRGPVAGRLAGPPGGAALPLPGVGRGRSGELAAQGNAWMGTVPRMAAASMTSGALGGLPRLSAARSRRVG